MTIALDGTTSSPTEPWPTGRIFRAYTQHHSRPSSFHLWQHPSNSVACRTAHHTIIKALAVARRECQVRTPETFHIMAGIVQLADHGLHGLVRSCGTPDSLLLTHGLSPTTGEHGGRFDTQPVTRLRSSQ